MGATVSEQWHSLCEDDEEPHPGQGELPEDSAEDSTEDRLLQKNGQITSQNGKTESQTDEMNSLSEERDLVDVGSGFVTLNEDDSDMTDSIQEGDVSNNSSKQMNNTDEVITKEENEANNKVNDSEIELKKIFRFGGFKFKVEQGRNAAGPSEDSWNNADVNHIMTNEQDKKEIKNERIGVDASAGLPKTHSEMAEGTPDKRLMQDAPQSPEPEEPMSPIKQFFSQGILSSLRKKRKELERPKENIDELKCLEKVVEKKSTKEDTTCSCLDVSSGKFDEDKDLQLYKKDECKPASEGDIMNSDKMQASPFKRLFRKLSTRRQSETKPGDTNSLEPGENISENHQLSTELIKFQKEHEKEVVETQPGNEMMDTSHEDSKKKSDSTISWENLLCVRSARTRSRKMSDSEDETQAKGGVPRGTTESPFESSTEGDHLTLSNEQGESPAEEDSGSTWKSFKKLVTPKRKSRVEESGSLEQMHLESEITSLRKLISGRKKIKSDGQQDYISSDEGSKGTGADVDDDETPGVVPLSEYELAEPQILKVSTDGADEIKKENEMQPIIKEDEPKKIQPLYNVKPLSLDAWPSSVPIPTEYMEDLTEFLSKHQQLSDIPEEGIVEESVATPPSFVEWTTQYDTLADDIVDMTADAVTAREHPSEHNEDETSEMVSAVSHLSESPKTSGNVTPVSPVHHMRLSDTIFQEVVESASMVPSVLSNTTQDKVPGAQAVSVSQFIVESATTTKTKVLVTHKKEEATSICIGILCKKIRAETVQPLPLFEGISEINYALPTEFVSEDFAEACEAAEMSGNNVYETEINEIKTMLNEVLLLEEQSTILAETAKKSEQPEDILPLVNIEDVEDDSTELLNKIYKSTPVAAVVYGGSQLPEEQIIKQNMNRSETEGRLQPALEEPVYEQLNHNTQIHFEIEKEQKIENVLLAADVKQLQDTEVGKPVGHSIVAFKSDPALKHAFEITADMAGVVVSDVKCSVTTALTGSVGSLSDSIKIELDLENEAQMGNGHLTHFVDSYTIQGKVNTTELQREDKNDERVPRLNTTMDTAEAFENIKMTKEVENAKQKIEPTSADTIEEVSNEKIYIFEAESLSEIMDKPTEESELGTFVRENFIPVGTPNEENAIKEPEGMSGAFLGLEKEHTKTDTILVQDCMGKLSAGNKSGMLTPNPTETGEDTKKPPAVYEQARVSEEVAEDGVQQPATDNSQPTFSKLITDTQTTTVATGSEEKDLAKTEIVNGSYVNDELDKLVVNEQEHNETANTEITTELETVETVEIFPEVEPQLDPVEPQTEFLPSKPEKNEATKSSHDPYKENNQATEAAIKETETILTETITCEEETEVECNSSDQPEPQIEILSMKPEGTQATESTHKPYEEINQVTNTAEISKTNLSVLYKEETVVEYKIFDQTGQSVDEEPVRTMKHITKTMPKDEAETPEGIVISQPEWSEHVMEAIKDHSIPSLEAVNEHEVEMTVGSEKNIVHPDETEQEKVSDIDTASATDAKKNTEPTEVLKLKDETTMIVSEGQTVVTSEQVAESSIGTENQREPEMLTRVMNKLKAEAVEMAESKSDIIVVSEIQAETGALVSLIPELEAGAPVVTSREKTINIEALALTSVINNFQSDVKPVNEPEDSTGATRHKTPIINSEIQTGLFIPQTAAPYTVFKEVSEKEDGNINRPIILEVTEPKQEMLLVTETISHTSVVPSMGVQTTETSALETGTLVGTCEEKDVEAQGSVVTSIQKDTDVDSLVLTSTVSEVQRNAEAQRPTVVPVIETLTDVEMPFTGPELEERHCDAQAEANIEVKRLTLTEVKVTEIIEQVAEDMENTKNPKKDSKIPEEICGRIKDVSVPIMKLIKSLPEAIEDIWEDAIDDIRDDQCSSTKASGEL